MNLDKEKLTAKGFTVDLVHGGAMISTPTQAIAVFVPMKDGALQLITQRSAFHREIYEALAGAPAPDGPP